MPSIINGLFAGRSGITSHGTAIAALSDNIGNASTPGYKTIRAEFEDLMAGGQTTGKIIGSGSQISAVSTIFQQGTLESTGRPLDLGIDGNGFFVVAQGAQRFYTRAGNFKIDDSGYLVNQENLNVLGFPASGTGALEALNVNTISQESVATTEVSVAGNVSATATVIDPTSIKDASIAGKDTSTTTTYAELNAVAEFSTVVDVFDSLGASHTVTFFYFRTAASPGEYTVRGYVNSEDVDTGVSPVKGLPRVIADSADTKEYKMLFSGDGSRSNAPATGSFDLTASVQWNNGSNASSIGINMGTFTQFSSSSNVSSITQNGQGIGTVTSISVQTDGKIFAMLDNGQSAIIGTVGMANFSNAEGLTRVGKNLLQQSPQSGEPVIGRPMSGTLGTVKAGTMELSTVDIADQFVKLITLQKGYQANSRIIVTINQLLQEIIQLV